MAKNKTEEVVLRDYQVRDKAAIEEAWKINRGVLYQLPTGGGKSVVFASIVEDYKKEQVLVLAHKRRLLTQTRKHLKNRGVSSGLIISNTEENTAASIIVASVRTVTNEKRLQKLLRRTWNKVIIDEAHHSMTTSYQNVLDSILEVNPDCKLLGVTATPYRQDKKRLDTYYSELICSDDVSSLIAQGFLSKYRVYQTPIGEITNEVTEYAHDYKMSELSAYMRKDKFLKYVVDAYETRGEKRQTIIFAVDRAHASDMLQTFQKRGYKSSAVIDSSMESDDVQETIEQFANKELDILINIEMLTEGVDLPDTGCIICARPTKSLTLYLQMLGRGLRPKADKSELIIIDCAGNTEEFGTVSSKRHWSLNPEIDPSSGRSKNKVLGRNKQGELTDDPNEIEDFSELVEMTPEEYMTQIAGGKEEAEKSNEHTKTKAQKILEEIAGLLQEMGAEHKKKVFYFIESIDKDSSYRSHEVPHTIIFYPVSVQSQKKDNLWYTSKSTIDIEVTEDSTRDNRKKSKNRFYLTIDGEPRQGQAGASVQDYTSVVEFVGKVNRTLLTDIKQYQVLQEKIEALLELNSSLINISSFDDAIKTAKEEAYLKAAQEHAVTVGKFVNQEARVNRSSLQRYFPNLYTYGEVKAMKISKINKHMNIVIMVVTDGSKNVEVEKKFVKQEKIIEILKDFQWKPTSK